MKRNENKHNIFFLAMVAKSGIETPDINIIKKFKDFNRK